MVDNPADLVQPRAETPPYEMRRTNVMGKYRTGDKTGAEPAESLDKAKISDLGK